MTGWLVKLLRFNSNTPCVALCTGSSSTFIFRQGLFDFKIENNNIFLEQKSWFWGERTITIYANEIIDIQSFHYLFLKGIRIVHNSRFLDEYFIIFPQTHRSVIEKELSKFNNNNNGIS